MQQSREERRISYHLTSLCRYTNSLINLPSSDSERLRPSHQKIASITELSRA